MPLLPRLLRLPHGIPSHDTFGRVFSLLEPAGLVACIKQWLDEIGRVADRGADLLGFVQGPLRCEHLRVDVRRNPGGPPALRRLAGLWVALVFCQIALGAWTIWSNKAADIATAHVAVGAIMLSFGVSISAICSRISKINFGRARHRQFGSDPGAPHSEPVAA